MIASEEHPTMPSALISIDVQPAELDGKWWVNIRLGDLELKRQGPFTDAKAAEAAADRLIARWAPTNPPPAANNAIMFHGEPVPLDSDLGRKFVVDAVRAAEGLITDSDLREKYEISAKNLKEMTKNPALIKAIRDERERRMRNGTAAREAAQRHFIKAPDIMNSIMSDQNANPRHRIESAREIRATATGGGDETGASNASERFVITFNLGADVERIEKTVTPRKSPPKIEGKIDAES
jgi:hypothetical protein